MKYRFIIGEDVLKKISSYKEDLQAKRATPGEYLKNELRGKDLASMSLEGFIQLLLFTKKPLIFAESEISCDGSDWNAAEFSILGDINFAAKVKVYDNGKWAKPSSYEAPYDAGLLFTPGLMLNIQGTGDNNPDYNEVVEHGTINQSKYMAAVKRRLLPLFQYIEKQAQESGHKAVVVLPAIGCGMFAGEVNKGVLHKYLNKALEGIMEAYSFPNIEKVEIRFHSSEGVLPIDKVYRHTHYIAHCSDLPQLTISSECASGNYLFFKIVAWDHCSFPGNDYYGGARQTDDGVSAAATNVIEIITGHPGVYQTDRFIPKPDQGLPDKAVWIDVVNAKNIKLIANDQNILIACENGISSLAMNNVIREVISDACKKAYEKGYVILLADKESLIQSFAILLENKDFLLKHKDQTLSIFERYFIQNSFSMSTMDYIQEKIRIEKSKSTGIGALLKSVIDCFLTACIISIFPTMKGRKYILGKVDQNHYEVLLKELDSLEKCESITSSNLPSPEKMNSKGR